MVLDLGFTSYPDIPFGNRESPKGRLYETVKNYPPVILLKKQNGPKSVEEGGLDDRKGVK